MRKLNLPAYEFRYRTEGEMQQVLDVYRKRFVVFTPEEEVRQRFARYLVEEKGFPASLLMTEYALTLNKMKKTGRYPGAQTGRRSCCAGGVQGA
jgi:hypothetical protein